MKLTSKDKIIMESLNDKIEIAREFKRDNKYYEAIQAYHKVLFLKEQPQYLFQLAQVYEKMRDISSAILYYRRVHQLKANSIAEEKVKIFSKIQGLQLLQIGSIKNILQDTQFQPFIKRYPLFHKKMLKKVAEKSLMSDFLQSCLAYLQVNQRQLALSQIQNCILIDEKDAQLLVLKALLNWSLMQNAKGYRQFWNAYILDRTNTQVQIFLEMITPQLQQLYKDAKYDLIDRKMQKCKLKVKKGLEIHPYHTQFLILSAYLHRVKEEYEAALSDLQLANKHFQDRNLEEELKNQISLTYNEMGIYLYRQSKFAEASTLFTEGLTFKANDWGILTNRGDCYKALNQYVNALQDYLKAHEIQKKNEELNFRISSIYNIRGIALFNSKNYELSLKQFEDSIYFSPKCAQFYLSKAKCLLQLNRKAEAVQALEICLGIDEKITQAGQLIQQLKQPQERKGKNNRKIIQISKEK